MNSPMLALVLVGCIEIGLDPIDDTDPPVDLVPVTETFVQAPLPATDVLLVVDDTSSMGQEQAALAAEIATLATSLDEAGVAWHIGVATTDMSGTDVGWLQGAPYVLSPSTPSVETTLANRVQAGTTGAAPEAGFAAALTALELAVAGDANAGFRRPDAALHVIFFSDADDASDTWLGDDPVAVFLAFLAAEAASSGAPAIASGVVGDVPAGCISDRGNAQAGVRYEQAIRATGGALVSICATDFQPLVAALGDLTVAWPMSFPLRQMPVSGSLHVSIDEVEVLDGWHLDEADLAIVFDVPPPPSSRIAVSYLVENA